METMKLPESWKEANVTPIQKKGPKNLVENGFRKGKSCATQLMEVLDNWTEQLDNRNAIDIIYLDFQNAFDTVPRQRLINKLQSYGICGNIVWWIREFLTNRKQNVLINGTGLECTTVTSGIPQGSVPGSIFFFSIYIKNLPDVVQNIASLFSDDTKVYAIVNKEEEQHSLHNDINNRVHINNNISTNRQNKASQKLGMIKRSFSYMDT